MKILRFSGRTAFLAAPLFLLVCFSSYAQTQILKPGNAAMIFMDTGVDYLELTLHKEMVNGKEYYLRKVSYVPNISQYSFHLRYDRIDGDSVYYILKPSGDSLIFNFNWEEGRILAKDSSETFIYFERIDSIRFEDSFIPDDTIYYACVYSISPVIGGDTIPVIGGAYRYSKKLGRLDLGIWSAVSGVKIDGTRYGYVGPFPEEIEFSSDSLYSEYGLDTVDFYIRNTSDYNVSIDSVFTNHGYGYYQFFIKGTDALFVPFFGYFPRDPGDSLKYLLPSHDSVHVVITAIDLCPLCLAPVVDKYFTDTLIYSFNFKNPEYIPNNNFNLFIPITGFTTASDIDDQATIPGETALYQNYPNPFNPETSIRYALNSKQFVEIKVYDALGREAALLVNEEKPAGTYEIRFNGSDLASGIYFYTFSAGEYHNSKKLILLK
jgi:hypothetical protein